MHNGARAVIPALWHLEVANSLAIAERRGILRAPDVERSLNDFEKLLAVSIDTDATLISAREALATVRPYGLTAYDGAYLYLARRHGWPLATLDEKLKLAARSAGVVLLH
jgi:predicted nucleic acid-binding protein